MVLKNNFEYLLIDIPSYTTRVAHFAPLMWCKTFFVFPFSSYGEESKGRARKKKRFPFLYAFLAVNL